MAENQFGTFGCGNSDRFKAVVFDATKDLRFLWR